MEHRCGNCGKYPFCSWTQGANYYCTDWKAKQIMKLDSMSNGYCKFSRLDTNERWNDDED